MALHGVMEKNIRVMNKFNRFAFDLHMINYNFTGIQHQDSGEIMEYFLQSTLSSLQWSRNERDGISNHQPHDCLLNSLYRHRSN